MDIHRIKRGKVGGSPTGCCRLLYLLSIIIVLFFISSATQVNAKHLTTSAGDPANGIVRSRHNLSSGGYPFRGPTSEVCVFCHTPHWAGDTAPLWNRQNSVTSFTGENGSFTPNAGSLACLSCHDGQTAFDALINRPGHGSNTNGTATDLQWAFYMPVGNPQTGYDHLYPGDDATHGCANCHVGQFAAAPWANPGRLIIGTNLTDDHPISVAYQEGEHSLRPTNTALSSIDLSNGDGTVLVTGNLWSIEGNIQNDGKISDLLEDGYVECVSCHDPHYKNQTNPDPDFVGSYTQRMKNGAPATSHTDLNIDGMFLRRVGGNSDSGVCRTCHDK